MSKIIILIIWIVVAGIITTAVNIKLNNTVKTQMFVIFLISILIAVKKLIY